MTFDDDDVSDDDESPDDDCDGGESAAPTDGWGWPSAITTIVFFLCAAEMWHDCFGR